MLIREEVKNGNFICKRNKVPTVDRYDKIAKTTKIKIHHTILSPSFWGSKYTFLLKTQFSLFMLITKEKLEVKERKKICQGNAKTSGF